MATEQQIEHSQLPIRGLNLHVAHLGKGELGMVVFLHSFPEIWYTWRHQMLAVAAAGYQAVAPDWRGYGLSDLPLDPEAAAYDDLVEDLLAILDALSVPKVAKLAERSGDPSSGGLGRSEAICVGLIVSFLFACRSLTSGIRARLSDSGVDMASLKYDLPLLDGAQDFHCDK